MSSHPKKREVVGVVIEHWMVKRLREHKPINLDGNVPRMSAETAIKLNDLRNKLLGTNYSLYEASQQALNGTQE